MLMAVISAHFATCWDLPWTSWTSLCAADGALEFVTLKENGSVSTTRFSGHNRGWPRNLFVELFSICHLKGNMIFVPLTLNIKWIRLVCM
jgi:hypothetical protein